MLKEAAPGQADREASFTLPRQAGRAFQKREVRASTEKTELDKLFELEPTEDPLCDHEHVLLSDGWQKLVSEAGFCDSCGEGVRPQACRSTHPTIFATATPR
jgi:hypothetical protein